MKGFLKIILITSIVVGLVVPLFGCRSTSNAANASENQTVTVSRGNLTIDITAAGNLVLSRTADLAFEVQSTQSEPLTVAEVRVEVGDPVTAGEVLATIDAKGLQDRVTSREQTVKTAELSAQAAEITLETAKDAEQSVKSAEIDLATVTDSYNKLTYPYNYSTFAFDVPAAIAAIHDAELQLEKVRARLETGPSSEENSDLWYNFGLALDNLTTAQQRLLRGKGVEQFVGDNMTSPSTAPLAVADFWTLRAAQLATQKSQIALDKAKSSFQTGLDSANNSLDKANLSLAQAQSNLDDAKADLQKAQIVAPFAGFVTQVNVKGGDDVKSGTVAVQIADPTKFEAQIMVNEMDILQVQLGGKATVQPSAVPALTLPAKVTQISPTATIQSGVVNYQVKVELEPLETAIQQQAAQQPGQRGQTGQRGQPGQVTTAIPENLQLREGLTVTVSIVVNETDNVLMVPNSAITYKGNAAYVQVVTPNGGTEQREIKTGISNWQYTEVTQGLTEGEKVIVPQKTTTTSTTTTPTSQQGQRPPTGFVPGMGRILR